MLTRLVFLLMIFATSSVWAQFGSFTRYQVGGVSQSPVSIVNFNTGLTGSLSGGTLTINVSGFASTSTTITGTAGVSGGGDLSANRTLSLDLTYAAAWTGAHTWTQSVGTAQTPSITLQNTTAATNNNQRWSPMLKFIGQGWDADGAASVEADAGIQLRPVQDNAPGSDLVFYAKDSNGTLNDVATFSYFWPGVGNRTLPILRFGTGTNVAAIVGTASGLTLYGTTPAGSNNLMLDGTNITIAGTSLLFGATMIVGTSSLGAKRIFYQGTAVTSGEYALSAGWGATASIGTITGSDNSGSFIVTANGAGIGANPTVTLTFKDGTWTKAPYCIAKLEASTDVLTTPITETTNATTLVITYNGTPVGAATYTLLYICRGTAT